MDGCQTCSSAKNAAGATETCDSCKDGYKFEGKKCVPCKAEEFFSRAVAGQSGTCTPCMNNCLSCQDSTTCDNCADLTIFDTNQCTPCTADKYYERDATVPGQGKCLPCGANCADCSTPTDCTSCEDQFIKDTANAGACVACDAHEFFKNGACEECTPNCDSCKVAASSEECDVGGCEE